MPGVRNTKFQLFIMYQALNDYLKQPIKSSSQPCQVGASVSVGQMVTMHLRGRHVLTCPTGWKEPAVALWSRVWKAQVLEIVNMALLRELRGLGKFLIARNQPLPPRTAFFLACAKLLADSMTGECYNYKERDGKHRKCCRHWFHQQKQPSKENTGNWSDVSRRKSCFFPWGQGKNTTSDFPVSRNSHLLSLLPFLSSECPHGAGHWLDQIQPHRRKCREMVQRKKVIVNTDNLLPLSNPSYSLGKQRIRMFQAFLKKKKRSNFKTDVCGRWTKPLNPLCTVELSGF